MPRAKLWKSMLSLLGISGEAAGEEIGKADLAEAMRLYEARQWKAALDEAIPLAEAGAALAQAMVGNIYAQGGLGAPDLALARRWWLNAAEGGHQQSQKNVGLAFLYGDGGPPDPHQAEAWLTEAILGGDTDAMSALGTALVLGDVIRKDPALGYMYLRSASPFQEPADDLMKMVSSADRERAETLTSPIANIRGVHRVGQCGQRDALLYFLNRLLFSVLGSQRRFQNSATATGIRIEDSIIDAALNMGELLDIKLPGFPFVGWTFSRRGRKLSSPEAIPVSADALWDIIRPCDQIEISDGINSHMTWVHGIDREAERIDFADAWPDDFLLLEGRNVEGVRATKRPLGRTRTLLSVTKQEFLRVVMGIITMDTGELLREVIRAFPELMADPAVHFAIGATMVQSGDPETASGGTGWLWDIVENDMVGLLNGREANMFADRLLLGIERCRQSGREQIGCIDLRTGIPTRVALTEAMNRVRILLERADLSTLHSAHAASVIGLKAAHDGSAAAVSLADRALTCSPDNEYLLHARGMILLREGRAEDATTDLDRATVVLRSRLAQPGPAFRNADGRLTGEHQKEMLGEFLGTVLILRMQAALASGRQDLALQDGLDALFHGADSFGTLTEVADEHRKARRSELAEQAEGLQEKLAARALERAEDAYQGSDFTTALKLYLAFAKLGVPGCQHDVADMYRKGLGADRDDEAAVKWFWKAAQQGFAPSEFSLGLMYQDGLGVRCDPGAAREWFKKAAEHGLAQAQEKMGALAYSEDNMQEAFSWFERAAAQNEATAMFNVGSMYYHGRGVAPDRAKAIQYYRQAAEHGLPQAASVLQQMMTQ